MHRTDADGHAANLYTEGNATLSIPATVVSAAAANSWQEELVNVILGAGLSLLTSTTDTYDQLVQAIIILIQNGGAIVPIEQVLSNNSSNQDVEDGGNDIEFDRTELKDAEYRFNIVRNTDSSAKIEMGILKVIYEPKNDTWFITQNSDFDDAGVIFSLAPGSDANKMKLQYSTDDLTGTSYFGELTLTHYKETRV